MVVPLSLIAPFLTHSQELLLPDTRLFVLRDHSARDGNSGGEGCGREHVEWTEASLVCVVHIPALDAALAALLNTQDGTWRLGWPPSSPSPHVSVSSARHQARIAAGFAVLTCSPTTTTSLHWPPVDHPSPPVGLPILICGSPFGALAPSHFANSVAAGLISNSWPPGIHGRAQLLMLDAHTLPGMEGAPVVDADGTLRALVLPPLCCMRSGAQIPLAVPVGAVLRALRCPTTNGASATPPRPLGRPDADVGPTTVQQAAASVVMVDTGRSWGSGVLISTTGVVLTNAHLLLTHRFDGGEVGDRQPVAMVRVRWWLDAADGGCTWVHARPLYVPRGPADVALLQLDGAASGRAIASHAPAASNSSHVRPIQLASATPPPGAPVVVIGHGLLGPKVHACPSAHAGVVSSLVRGDDGVPVMLQTTAAVHAGSSGGAVVDSHGRLVGMVTGNARLVSSVTMPHLNFSLPAEQLSVLLQFVRLHEAGDTEGALEVVEDAWDPADARLASAWSMHPAPPLPANDAHRDVRAQGSRSRL